MNCVNYFGLRLIDMTPSAFGKRFFTIVNKKPVQLLIFASNLPLGIGLLVVVY